MAFKDLRAETEKGLKEDKLRLSIFLFAILSILAQASLILTASAKLPPQVPLFYSKPWGESMLAPSIYLWILPLICLGAVVVNFSLAIFFLKEKKFIQGVLFVFSLIVSVTTLYDTVKIISLLT